MKGKRKKNLKKFLSVFLAGAISVVPVLSAPVHTYAQDVVGSIAENRRMVDDYLEMEAIEVSPEEVARVNAAYGSEYKHAQNNSSDPWQKYSSYYLYNQLSDTEKNLWEQWYASCISIMNGSQTLSESYTSYATVSMPISTARLRYLTTAFRVSNPQFYFLQSGFSYSNSSNTSVAFMVYNNFCNGSSRAAATSAFRSQIESWESTICAQTSDFDKVKKAHDIVVTNVEYNNSVVADGIITSAEEQAYYTQSAYSMVCMDATVCAGYSQAFTLLCNGAGVDAFSVTSIDHQWNKVRVNDSWYNVDCTWDDQSTIYYGNFLKNQADFHTHSSHVEEACWATVMPACTLTTSSGWSVGTLPATAGTTSKPTFSVTRTGSQYEIAISDSTAGAKIYYTIDGVTSPASAYTKSFIYTGTFYVADYTKVRAIAVCDTYKDSAVAAPEVIGGCAHTNTGVRNKTAATCGATGYTGDTYCNDCGQRIATGTTISATGHQHTELRNECTATCGEAGYTGDTYCKDCNTLITRGSSIAATGNHSWNGGSITTQPTSHTAGVRTYTCTVCGDTKTSEIPAVVPDVSVSYQTHVQSYGWQDYVSNGAMSGTSGEAKRLEGICIKVAGNENLGVRYTTHVQSYGWLGNSFDGGMSGTTGEAKRLEAIMIELYGADADLYDIYYRVHAQSYGWLGWAKNGAPAGTAGFAKRLEGIQIVVVKKNQSFDINMGGITSAYNQGYISSTSEVPHISSNAGVTYQTHVQSYGWQNYVSDGNISGTFGEAKRLEGIHIRLTGQPYAGSIHYTTHVQSYGWQGDVNNPATWKSDGEMAGTSGEAKRLEAICICLTGDMAEHYDVYYRVHAQSFGWMGWAKNGQMAGTAGYAYRLEAIQIKLVPKGGAAPGSTEGAFQQK